MNYDFTDIRLSVAHKYNNNNDRLMMMMMMITCIMYAVGCMLIPINFWDGLNLPKSMLPL